VGLHVAPAVHPAIPEDDKREYAECSHSNTKKKILKIPPTSSEHNINLFTTEYISLQHSFYFFSST
jgi:hypothetical protein